ncbi:MAG TPA: hypothetical protein DCS93_43550 [Microscillaceae bacterium]|nr:hypothetical protein [Microscillaceae bacterium]
MEKWEFKKDDFRFRRRLNNQEFLCVELNKIDQCMEYAIQNDIKHFEISYFHHYKSNDISFLINYIEYIEGLYLSSDFLDISPLNQLKQLKQLVFGDHEQQHLDLANLPKLVFLSFTWHKNIKNLDKAYSLESLGIGKYNPKSKDFSQLSQLNKLHSLGIDRSNITALSGLENLSHLQHLSLRHCPKLEKFQYFDNFRNLKSLSLDQCKRISGLPQIQYIKQLESLRMDGCPDISDIKFLAELKFLKKLYIMKTKVLDGNMSHLFKLKPFEELAYTNYIHYTHDNWDIMNTDEP